MKRILKKGLISILVVMLVSNLILYTPANISYAGAVGDFFDNLVGGFIGILLWVVKAPILGVLMGINSILTGIATIGVGSASSLTGASGLDDFFLTPLHIFFNKVEILDVNFLNLNTTNTVVMTFRTAVAGWYYSMRLIAAMVLVVILIYIGIKMAISTIAQEKALYKKMLVDWVTSLALLFLLHYIMIFIFACNDALVNAMGTVAEDSDMSTFMANLVEQIFFSTEVWLGIAALVVYGLMIFLTLTFLITYIKRMLTIGFLIIIAPLITITYSIDKIGDQKAQALNTWLKEFSYNILIQPFHCILYLSFGKVAMSLLSADLSAGESSLAAAVLAILCILYIKTGEELVKKIFGFDKAGHLASMAAGTAMAMAAVSQGGKVGAVAGKAVGKGVKVAGKGLNKGLDKMKNSNNKLGKKLGEMNSARQDRKRVRADEKLDDKAAERVRKKFGGSIDENSERFFEEKEKAREEITREKSEKAAARKEITGKIGTALQPVADVAQKAGNTVGKGARYVAKGANTVGNAVAKQAKKASESDLGKYLSANSSKIMGSMVGIATGMIGLGAGSAGAVAGYKMGSGFMEGLMPNSSKTIDNNAKNAAQTVSNLSGDVDVNNILNQAKLLGDNDGFKDLAKLLQELINKLNQLGVKNSATVVGNMSQQIASGGNVDKDALKNMLLGANNENMDPDKADEAVELLSKQGELMALQSLYNSMKLAGEQGRGMDDMAAAIGGLSSNASSQTTVTERETINTETHTTEETHTDENIEVDISGVANQLTSMINSKLNNQDIDTSEIDRVISEVNKMSEENRRAVMQQVGSQQLPGITVKEIEDLLRQKS